MKHLLSMKHLRAQSISTSNKSPTLLCLDFDGVLCDSLDECMLVAYNAYYQENFQHPLELPVEFRHFFYRNRYLVGPVSDYYYLVHAYETRQTVPPLPIRKAPDAGIYRTGFSQARQALKQDMRNWLQLHQLYAQSQCVLDDDFPEFFIVTNKDSDSVMRLAQHHHYAKKILGIYGPEIADEKSELMHRLLAEHRIDPRATTITFVDDNVSNLRGLVNFPIQLRLAAWGYCDPLALDEFPVLHRLQAVFTEKEEQHAKNTRRD
jgi:phosphoglycolate phosphatase-like HAD superfamily hydrolase